MISKKVEDAFNDQINAELYSAYIYMAMSAYLESVDLSGMAHWMDIQAEEEVSHAKKFADHIVERGGRVRYKAIDCPQEEWKSALDVPNLKFRVVQSGEHHQASPGGLPRESSAKGNK